MTMNASFFLSFRCEAVKLDQVRRHEVSFTDEINRRVKDLERRLNSVEQPLWKITRNDSNEWISCHGGVCRCLAGTKSLNCWNNRLRSVPPMQIVPTDVVNL